MTKIIAFSGRKQSGKTTSSEFVSSFFNNSFNVKIYNFADPLKKDICMNILGLTHNQCYGEDIYKNTLTNITWEGKKLTAREVMQFVGTDMFRKMKNDVWASATIQKIKNDDNDDLPIAIIADCRFPNEVDAIKRAGGYVIKLTRNLFNSDHASEIALDPENYDQNNFDLVIDNQTISIEEKNKIIHTFLQNKGILSL